jgi:hypothetical protein
MHRVVTDQRTGQSERLGCPRETARLDFKLAGPFALARGGGLPVDVPSGLRRQLGKLVGGDVRLVFEVADPNRKVSVPRPATG